MSSENVLKMLGAGTHAPWGQGDRVTSDTVFRRTRGVSGGTLLLT